MDLNHNIQSVNNLMLSKTRKVIALGFATQGLGYATVMTALPTIKGRFRLSDDQLSLIILGVCIAAALGSILADRIAVKLGSRLAVVTGFIFEAIGIAIAAFSPNVILMIASFLLYGLGLGCLDAALNMQAVMMEQRLGKSVFGGFFACYTAAAFLGALIMSATVSTALGATTALCIAVAIAFITSQLSRHWLFQQKQCSEILSQEKPAIPYQQLLIFGLIILIVFIVDSAISTWSSIYLKDVLASSATIAPLGYAAYQIGILLTRLSLDYLLQFKTATWIALVTLLIGAFGCVLSGISHSLVTVILGFALAGVAVGALVPLTYSAVGRLDESRRDEIIARVNIFNYGGAVAGAVIVGLLATPFGYAPSFIGLAFALLSIIYLRKRLV
ncbi:MFS transporter [Acinetobacter dispersus]|uniref:MFS transporter n=1 Tax=Acinetobacter dispersus TaxID=70348 RepID=UPI00132EA7D8|nr:MFS transporter [Acinetobacter dispersus]MCH7382273.1 MFS transporter [Acinetobacter dispersus]QHH96058.1 MFS transporter [Acinetobacter dispersus]